MRGRFLAAILLLITVTIMPVAAFEVKARTDAFTSSKVSDFTVEFLDNYFDAPSTEYNHKLAQASLGMALSAFRPSNDPTVIPNEHLLSFLHDCGFDALWSDDYDKETSAYTVSTVIGKKSMKAADGEDYTLIAVGICGGGYANEWLSNFTIGAGTRHEGFESASHLVFNRIFGFIGQNNITGRIKIWVSGFSRAAAISNITAADLVDCGVFRQEDIFAYTFATPRTTKEPREGRYNNIFNIVGQYDVVPQVPLSSWGFDRYGTTLYTPLREADSDFAERADRADDACYDFTGQHFWVNGPVNMKLHLLLGYVYSICPTQDDYVKHLQGPIISIFQDMSVDNILRVLSEITEDGSLINDSNRETASKLLDFMFLLVFNALTNRGQIASMWNTETNFTANLMHEHTQDVYLSWMLSSDDPSQIFTENTRYTRLSFMQSRENCVITVTEGESDVLFSIRGGELSGDYDFNRGIYVLIEEDQTVLVLPHDRDYRVWYQSDTNETLGFARIEFDTTQIGENEIYFGTYYGTEKVLVYEVDGKISDKVNVVTLRAGDFGENAKYLPPDVVSNTLDTEKMSNGWRTTVFNALIIPILIFLAVLILIVILVRVLSKKHFSIAPMVVCSLLLILFLLEELFFWLYRSPTPRTMTKIAIGLLLIGLAVSGIVKRKRGNVLETNDGSFFTVMASCVALFAIADLVIDGSATAGIILYALVHLALAVAYLVRRRLSPYQWVAWAALSFVLGFIVIAIVNIPSGLKVLFTIYACIVAMVMVAGHRMPTLVMIASMLLMMSDCMMGFYHSINDELLLHLAYNLVYYSAMFCFAYACFRHKDIEKDEARQGLI